jgi:ankyrin repeat protein
MSRTLPPQPSFEFLRKEAKALQRSEPHPNLAAAQHALARDYGFPNWAAIKTHVESLQLSPAESLREAVKDQDSARVRSLLDRHPELRAAINDPLPNYAFGQNALFAAVQRTDRATIQVLLDHGADINKRSDWWAGGFGVLDDCDPSLADFLIERGAHLDAHAAARLGRIDALRALLDADPSLVHARGGDGQTALHFASTVEIAALLLERGADINAIDIDHESTAAQYMLRIEQRRHYTHNRQDVARFLVSRGCKTDLLMVTALGLEEHVRAILDRDPNLIRMSVSRPWFPMQNPRAGGPIYIWQLGGNRTAHTVAREFGRDKIFQFLLERTPDDLRLALACELGDETVFREFLARNPNLIANLSDDARKKLPNAAQDNNLNAVRLMLQAGWPVDTAGEMGATALHWAAFHGNAAIAREVLRFHPSLEKLSTDHPSTALAWAIYGSGNGWYRDSGDYTGTVRALLDAGAAVPGNAVSLEPSDAVLEMLP